MKSRTRILFTSASVAAVLVAMPAWGQAAAESDPAADEDAGTIVVTADTFEKSIQDTPMSLTVVDGATITEEGRSRIDEVLKNEPGVIVQGAARGFLVSIRGLGLSLPPQMGQGAVSTNYDGAFSNRPFSSSNSRIRRISDGISPAYFFFQLK